MMKNQVSPMSFHYDVIKIRKWLPLLATLYIELHQVNGQISRWEWSELAN